LLLNKVFLSKFYLQITGLEKEREMTRALLLIAILLGTMAPLAAANPSSSPPSAKHCDNDLDNDWKEQPPKCADSDADGK